MFTVNSNSRTSAQIALEDNIFHELFGMIWTNSGYVIKSTQDLSWAILCKDFFLQGLSDYVNEGFINSYAETEAMAKINKNTIHNSAKEWVENESLLNNSEAINTLRNQILEITKKFYASNPRSVALKAFNILLKKVQNELHDKGDPFSFDKCCRVLGLEPEIARGRFMLYRTLKLKHGNQIRIVTYTGKHKRVNIPSLDDIIKAEEVNGEHDLTLFLHVGVRRELRNDALVRSKKE